MAYVLTKRDALPKVEKFGIALDIYPQVGDCGVVLVSTEEDHNQEFYDKESTFTYVVLEGIGTFFLNDEPVEVSAGDMLLIKPGTRIYYKGTLKMVLLTNPPWSAENEVETKSNIW